MALITCRECKKEISNEADNCPHCGVPTPDIYKYEIKSEKDKKRKKKEDLRGIGWLFLISAFVIPFVCYWLGVSDDIIAPIAVALVAITVFWFLILS